MSHLTHVPTLPDTSPAQQPPTRVKRPLVAAALSTLLPGAGQVFLKQHRKAAVLFVVLVATSIGFWPLRLPRSYPGLLSLLWVCLLLSLFAICDAIFTREGQASGGLSKWWIVAAIPLAYIGTNICFTSLLLASGFRSLQFASSSMEPTLLVGDKFIFDTTSYHRGPERRGDLVVLRRNGFLTVKRIVATGGDTIEAKQRQIFLNGELQNEPFIQHEFPIGSNPQLDTFGPISIPKGKYFVVGDNRDISLDSRMPDFGLVDAQSIVGKPLYAYRLRGTPHSRSLN